MALVGSVGDGKTTLLRRLLHGTGTVPLSRVKSERRQYSFIDAPGPIEFLRNLVSSAARVDAAVLVIDAAGSPLEQMLRHSALLRLIGVRDVVVAVNKMDLCTDAHKTFSSICEEIATQFLKIGLEARAFIPTIARDGVNLLSRSLLTSWYAGPTLMEALDLIDPRRDALRFRCDCRYRTSIDRTARAGSRDGSNPEASRSATRFCFLRVETRREYARCVRQPARLQG